MDNIEVILTKQERLELIEISENISKAEIIANYTLNDFDLKLVNECRLDYNKIGFALQLGILRHKGYSVQSNINIPKEILSFVAKQLNIKSKESLKNHFKDLNNYEEVIIYCGSGITASPVSLALNEIEIPYKFYTGSFSDWISYDENQVATI